MTSLDEGKKIVHVPETSVSHLKMFFFFSFHLQFVTYMAVIRSGMPWRVRHPNLQDGHSPFTCSNQRSYGIFLLKCFQQNGTLHSSFFFSGKLPYMYRMASAPIIRSTYNCIYSIWYLLNRYCYLLLLWIIWSWFDCDVGIVLINTIPTSHSN